MRYKVPRESELSQASKQVPEAPKPQARPQLGKGRQVILSAVCLLTMCHNPATGHLFCPEDQKEPPLEALSRRLAV